MKILVCGDRNWTDEHLIEKTLLHWSPDFIIAGGCRGADSIAQKLAIKHKWSHTILYAKWNEHGKAAGPIRNIDMLALDPDLVLAFHDDIMYSKGTKHMLSITKKKGTAYELVCHRGVHTNYTV